MKFARLIAAGAALLASAGTVQAQVTQNCNGTAVGIGAGCAVTNTVTSTVPYIARLILSNAATSLTAPVAADFGTLGGVNTAAAITLEVRSNSQYTVTAAAAAANFTGGSGNKLASSLTFTTDGSIYKPVAGTGSVLGTGVAATASTVYTIGYKTLYDWVIDTPGAYTLGINYTLTAP
ncbi:MAG: hypothetical protein IT355_14800 [Gemmatimonadaceae bacterium]|nr:hypothetical protein [Gemmatimonadaceae bacterium]